MTKQDLEEKLASYIFDNLSAIDGGYDSPPYLQWKKTKENSGYEFDDFERIIAKDLIKDFIKAKIIEAVNSIELKVLDLPEETAKDLTKLEPKQIFGVGQMNAIIRLEEQKDKLIEGLR
ncbi:MAG TPA: hypothetical protein VFQ86_01860 [Arachidicoccus soli]|nr:hypothetical protein [Arachidicoccus soli]